MFRDEATIEVVGGKGGDGIVAFRREKYIQRGGPSGGDGGSGGSVTLTANREVTSLLRVGRSPRYAGQKGQPGGPQNRSGRSGGDLEIEVPVGTQVRDGEKHNLLKDLARHGLSVVVARGGRGGRGNASFANAVQQAPRNATPGQPGERRVIELQLKLFAEVGLVGLPNAGKSTFLAAVTAATPKVADYPFTTLAPEVGIAEIGTHDTLVLADLPGLIEGAAEGHGLGHRFLKHVERCSVLLQLVDVSAGATNEPLEAYRVVAGELEAFSPTLAAKPRLVVASKCEDAEARGLADELERAVGTPVLRISSATRQGLAELLAEARRLAPRGVEPEPA